MKRCYSQKGLDGEELCSVLGEELDALQMCEGKGECAVDKYEGDESLIQKYKKLIEELDVPKIRELSKVDELRKHVCEDVPPKML